MIETTKTIEFKSKIIRRHNLINSKKMTSKTRLTNVVKTSKNKFKFNLCYNYNQIEHKTKKCFESLKKSTTNVNAIRKNKIKIKIFSRIIEIDDNNSKNWKNLSSSSSLSKQIRINSNSMKFSFESTSTFRKNDNRKWISWMKSLT